MDDKDKNVVEQIVDGVNDLVESIANTASEALEPATRSPAPKPKSQSVPDYEFPAPSGANPLSTPMKKLAADKENTTGEEPVKNRREFIEQAKGKRQAVFDEETFKALEMSDTNVQINF